MSIRNITTLLIMLTGILSSSAQGLTLFSPEMRDAADYPHRVVMDFLERYFGEELPAQRQTTREHKLADDKIYFRKGQPSDLYHITDTMAFSINMIDRHYEVEWKNQEEPFVTVAFPAQYDLILGMNQNDAQQRLKEAIISAPIRNDSLQTPISMQMQDDGTYIAKTEMFELESLNDAVYYSKVYDDFLPVFANGHLEYSAANMFHGLIPDADYRMYVEQSVYGMSTVNYLLTLNQWLNYCAQLGMKIFFGVEEQREDGILAIVIAKCETLGFNHLLSVVIPDKFVDDKNAVLKVRLTPYIPTHNVKNLYQKETKKTRIKI